MAGGELAGQLAVIEEALKRLEGELVRDPAWQALRSTAELDVAESGRLLAALDANPVYRAWRNMREAADMLEARLAQRPVAGVDAPDAHAARMATTLAEALQQIAPEATSDTTSGTAQRTSAHDAASAEQSAQPMAVPADVAQVLAAQVAAQVVPQSLPSAPANAPALHTAEEREQFEVGHRATQAVERILAIPIVEPIAPRQATSAETAPAAPSMPAPAPVTAFTEPPRAADDDIGHSVPLEAEDLAFLLQPAARVQTPAQSSFLKRLVSETQPATPAPPPLASADPFMVPPATPPPAPATPPDTAAPEAGKDPGDKPRLARLLKAWSRN